MCGIAGYFTQQPVPVGDLTRTIGTMNDSLRHRGPESEGVYIAPTGHLALGHRRLAFLDLTPTGAQPMFDSTGRYALIFVGEIYNFRKLKEKLLARGVSFRSTGDSEVLLYLLAQEGIEALAQLRGMFSLAFWDSQEQSLLLARDRFGIKPMVYVENGLTLSFASEIRALEAIQATSKAIDPTAFYWYLLWGTIAAPATWLKDVQALPPGHWRRYQVGKAASTGCFADIRNIYSEGRSSSILSERELREQTGPAVEASVRHHLESDVPVGVFLSGGIDSSAMVSAVRQVSSSSIQTYTITFAEDAFNEAAIAQEVARRFETEHHVFQVTASDFLKDWPRILSHLDQPSVDGYNSFYVSQVVAQAGQKVVLSGTGGDEFFGGYPSFRRLPEVQNRASLLRWVGPLLAPFQKKQRRTKFVHLYRHAGQITESYRSLRGLFMPAELDALAGPAWREAQPELMRQIQQWETSHFAASSQESILSSISRLEVIQYLTTQLLRDIDVMSMAHSLEVRVPFIDHVLAETLWPSLGHHSTLMQNKRLLYETLKRPVPEAVYQRPKQGFSFPMQRWVTHELRPMIQAGLQYLVETGWLNPVVPQHLDQALQEGSLHWSRPWALAVFGQMAMMRSLR